MPRVMGRARWCRPERPLSSCRAVRAKCSVSSMSRLGVIRSSHFRIHHACSARRDMTAGTRIIPITLASINTAAAMPIASILTVGSGSSTKLVNTTIMIAAAVVITADADSDTAMCVGSLDPCFVNPRDQKDLVIHGQPEHDGEHEHRHERRYGKFFVDADQR